MRRLLHMLVLALAALAPAMAQDAPTADDSPMPGDAPRLYYPASNNTDILLGTMRLGTHLASFKLLRGQMTLAFVGEMPGPEGLCKGQMQMYRITNAQAFFSANKGRNGFCPKPLEYLGIARLDDDRIRVGQFYVSGAKGLLDETAAFRANEQGGLGLCEADTFDDGRVRTIQAGTEVYQTAIQVPMASADVRRIVTGAWIVPDQNPDKLSPAMLRVVQVFRKDGTGVLLSYDGGKCGAKALRRFAWTVRGDVLWISRIRPAAADGDLLIGEGPTRLFGACTPGLFARKDRSFRLAYVPQCAAR